MIYADNAATTKMSKAAIDAMPVSYTHLSVSTEMQSAPAAS